MVLDLSKLVRVETLFCDVLLHQQNRREAEPEFKDKCCYLWLEATAKHRDNIFIKGSPTQEFLSDFGNGAARAFLDIVKRDFQSIDLSQIAPAQPVYYVAMLGHAPTLDLIAYLAIADSVWKEVDEYYQNHITAKIKMQLEDKYLKEYFLEDYDKLFKEKGYEIMEYKKLNEAAFAHYLFLLADNKMEDLLKHQLAASGSGRVKRYNSIIIPPTNGNNTGTGS